MKTTYPSKRPSERNSVYREKQGARFSLLGSSCTPCSRCTTDTERERNWCQETPPQTSCLHATHLSRIEGSQASISQVPLLFLVALWSMANTVGGSPAHPRSHAVLKGVLPGPCGLLAFFFKPENDSLISSRLALPPSPDQPTTLPASSHSMSPHAVHCISPCYAGSQITGAFTEHPETQARGT